MASLTFASIPVSIILSGFLYAQTAGTNAQTLVNTPKQVVNGSARLIGPYDQSQRLRLAIGLKPPKAEEHRMFLEALHTPGSPEYHRFLSPKEWNDRFTPSPADEQAVVDWANSQGLTVTHRFPNRLIVDVEGPVTRIQQTLGITINRYQLNGENVFSNDRDPVIPASLADKILCVAGLDNIQVNRPHSSLANTVKYPDYAAGPASAVATEYRASGDGSKLAAAMAKNKAQGSGVTPSITPEGAYEPTDMYGASAYDLIALSNLGHCCNPNNNPGGSPPETSIAILSIGSVKMSDLDGFQKQYPYLAFNVTVIDVDGTSTDEDVEGTLDVEWATAFGNSFDKPENTAHVYLYEGGTNTHATFLDLYNHILTDGHARVMSTSWGAAEIRIASAGFLMSEDAVLSAMAAQGWTLVAASDDQGSVADCQNVSVEFPASSPNVVAAGGTTLFLNSDGTYNREVGWTGRTSPGSCFLNLGGGGGGFSAFFGVPFYQAFLGLVPSVRTVPDISLNAGFAQTIYVRGELTFDAGTSIIAPELAGFFAQENAYLLFLQTHGHLCFSGVACAPMGNPNFPIYAEQMHAPGYAPHYPFYDITTGCASNDITLNNPRLTFYCAGPGYDLATGLGSINMLQLAWAINFNAAGDFGAPAVEFTGPPVNKWYNTDQQVNMGFFDTTGSPHPAIGLAGFSLAWDKDPAPESFFEATPGSKDAFYHGPDFPNQDRGVLILSQAGGQGCHTANAKAWDNAGTSSGVLSYGPLCYDTVPPVTTATLTGTSSNGVFTSSVVLKLSVAETGSGVASTQYSLNGGTSFLAYTGPVTISAPGAYTLKFFSKDVATNVETTRTKTFTMQGPAATTTTLASSLNPSTYGRAITLTAIVTAPAGTTPTGTVTFRNGSTSMGVASLSGGKATFVAPVLAAGSHSLTAAYAGSSTVAGSTSPVITETVDQALVNISVASSLSPSVFGKAVTFTATIVPSFGGPPVVGTVTFKTGTTVLGTVNVGASTNKATFTTSALGAGSHTISATYSGDANHLARTSPGLGQAVSKAPTTTTVVSSLNPSSHGSLVTLTATLTQPVGTAVSGTVTFKDGTVILGTAAVNASTHKAAFATSALAVGSHTITAVYPGTVNLTGSTSAALTQVVR